MNITEELYLAKLELDFFTRCLKNCSSSEEIRIINKEINYYNKLINRLYFDYTNSESSECLHPLWFLLSKDKEYGVVSYDCKCLICGKEMIKKDSFFKDVIGYNSLNNKNDNELNNYEMVKEEFDKDYKKSNLINVKRKMLSKYRV